MNISQPTRKYPIRRLKRFKDYKYLALVAVFVFVCGKSFFQGSDQSDVGSGLPNTGPDPSNPVLDVSKPINRDDGFDVIDIGSSKGSGSINFLSDALDSLGCMEKKRILDPRTLGLDYDPVKVQTCNTAQKGTKNECRLADVLKLTPGSIDSKRPIRGNTYWHVLEHIPNCEMAEKMWIKAAALSKSFSNFHGPAFDRELSASGESPTGYHRYWENWSGHKCHFNSTMLERSINMVPETTAYLIVNFDRIDSTDHRLILPKGSEKNSGPYDPSVHPEKESISLSEKNLYGEMRGCATYDSSNTKYFSIFTAICFRDVMMLNSKYRDSLEVVSCSYQNLSGAECVQMLAVKVMETLENFYQTEDYNVLNIV